MKGQAGIELTIPTLVGGVMAIIISSILVYAVFYPTATALNTNSTASGSLTNSTTLWGNGSTNHFISPTAHNLGGTLTIVFWNTTATGGTIQVQVGGNNIGSLAPAVGTNTSVTFTNVTAQMMDVATPTNISFSNITAPSAVRIGNSTLTWSDTEFPNSIPQAEQGNFNLMLTIVGISLVIIATVVIARIAGFI